MTDGGHGPRIAPFTADRSQALESLSRLEDSSAAFVLPGHGEPWTAGMAEAIKLIRAEVAIPVHG